MWLAARMYFSEDGKFTLRDEMKPFIIMSMWFCSTQRWDFFRQSRRKTHCARRTNPVFTWG